MQDKRITAFLLVACFIPVTLQAEPAMAPTALLDQSMRILSESTQPVRIDFDYEGVIKTPEKDLSMKQHYTFLFKGKEMLQMTFMENGEPYLKLYSTGNQFSIHYVTEQYYATQDQVTTRESLLSSIFSMPFSEGGKWLSEYLIHKPELLDAITDSKYTGEKEGVQHIQLSSETYEASLQFSSGEQPQLQEAILELSKNFAGHENTPTVIFKLLNIRISEDESITDEYFMFTPGEDDFNLSNTTGAGLNKGDKAAPVSLPLLDGETVKLSEHRGKDIVVLDFFATWCTPCRMMMPTVEKLRKSFEDKGVVFYAVNQEESPEKINGFMQSLNLEMPVLMDQRGLVSLAYGVNSIPYMVIIGKDGTIKATHLGGDPNAEQNLTRELKELLLEK